MTSKIMSVRGGVWGILWIGFVTLLVLGLIAWNNASAAEYTMKIGHATAKDCVDELANLFAKEVETRSGGRIKAPVYNASQLGNNPKMNKDVRSGAQEVLVQPAGFSVPYVPILGVFDLPFLFPNDEIYAKIINTEVTDPFRKAARGAGVEIVAFIEAAFKYFNTTFPVNKAEDLKGRKMRVIQSPVLIDQFKAFGSIGIPMPLSEVYTGLQQGVIEGQENPADLIERMKFHEVAKYITRSGHGSNILMILVNRRWLNSLPADLQQAVREAGAVAGRAALETQRRYERRSVEVLKQKAIYSELPEAERAKLKVAGQTVWAKMRKDPVKAEVIDRLIQAIEAAK